MSIPILEVQQLTKKYGSITAVNHLDLTVEKGNIFGILGPNGSGKTTTLGMVAGIIRPKEGTFRWFQDQYSEAAARKRLGILLETPNFYPYLNAVRNLEIVAHIKKVKQPRIEELLELVNLSERKKSNFRTYSLGMKQRLAIAGAMIGEPEVLIFDEPTNGLDPQGIAEVRRIIQEIASMGKTIIMASHILDEVEKICTHVAIIKKGNLLAQGTVGAIISDDAIVEVGVNADYFDGTFKEVIQAYEGVKTAQRVSNLPHFELTVAKEFDAARFNHYLCNKGLPVSHLVKRQRSLEAEFLEITK